MKTNILRGVFLLLIACLICGVSFCLWFTFANPDLTYTKLLLKLWPVYLAIVVSGVAIRQLSKRLFTKKRISKITYLDTTLTVYYTDGSKEQYEGSCTVWHKHPYMERAGIMTETWLSEIYTYIKKFGNPYPTAHLNKKETT